MRVCVVGSGAAGIIAVKTCLEYGIEPVCLERDDDIGGLWRFKPNDVEESVSSVMKSTIINTSKEMMAFSDYPPPPSFPNYMHNTKVMEYFRMYASHFNVMRHVRFGAVVTRIEQAPDYEDTGRFVVHYYEKNNNNQAVETFDGVFLCTGHHAKPYVPEFKGLGDPNADFEGKTFKGRVVVAKQYKTTEGFEKDRVLVVGIGNSGGDISVELSHICPQVYLSTRRGTWVNYRVGDSGWPNDQMANNRFLMGAVTHAYHLVNKFMEYKLGQKFDHAVYNLKPNCKPMDQHPFVNDELANRIIGGSIVIKPNVAQFTEHGCVFEDGSTVESIDTVVLATGYEFGFPFLQEGLIDVKNNRVSLYKNMLPPHLKHHTLWVPGCVQPWGAINPIAELQCRIACSEMTKMPTNIPSKETMLADIDDKHRVMMKRYVSSQRHTIQVDYVPFMDELADLIDVRPRVFDFLFSEPRLALEIIFGPCLPYHFRLRGQHAWSGARDAIYQVWDRTAAAFHDHGNGKDCKRCGKTSKSKLFLAGLIAVFVLIAVLYRN